MFLSEWHEFPSVPCLVGGKNLMTAHVSMLLKSCASLTCFQASFLPGQAKDLSAPRYKNSDCTSHRTVWTLLPNCQIEVLTAYGHKSAWNLNTTELLCFVITTTHSHLHLNWWLGNVHHTSNNAPSLGPVLLPCHPLWPSATWTDYTYTLFSLHGYHSWTVWPCIWFRNIMNYLPCDAAPCPQKPESS
jgi:hypothetical protein